MRAPKTRFSLYSRTPIRCQDSEEVSPITSRGCSLARIVPTAKTADILSLVLLLMVPAYVLPLAVIEDSRTPESIQDGESLSSLFGTFGGIRLPPQNFGTAGSRIPRAYSRVRKVRFLTC